MPNNNDKDLFKQNLEIFLEMCEKSKSQKTIKGLKPSDINGTFNGFKFKANFGSGNLVKRPSIAFLKGNNTVNNGIYPIIVYIPDKNKLITCKGVSFDNKSNKNWSRILEDIDILFKDTPYYDKKGQYSYFRNSYSLVNFNEKDIENIMQDIQDIMEDF